MISAKGIIDNKEICFEFDNIATNANGILVKAQGTTILCTLTLGEESKIGFKPLFVHYFEKMSAIDRIPGGFKKRESLSDSEILISRIIDRTIRPLIDPMFSKEINLYITLLSYDGYSVEVLSLAGASLILNVAGILNKIVSIGKLVETSINSSVNAKYNSFIFLNAICENSSIMIESEGKKSESLEQSFELYQNAYKITEVVAKEINNIQMKFLKNYYLKSLMKRKTVGFFEKFRAILLSKKYFKALINNDAEKLNKLKEKVDQESFQFQVYFKECVQNLYIKHVFLKKIRLDGRSFDETREFKYINNIVPSKYANALFEKGKTQSFISLTLGEGSEGQKVESIDGVYIDNFISHYNFLPFASFKFRKNNSIARREIGHGDLIKKGLKPVLLKNTKTIRLVSDITCADGSTSMNNVTGGSIILFLENLISELVAGVSIGKFKYNNETQFITDLTQSEDAYLSEIDIKISSTKTFITAIQYDTQEQGISYNEFCEILKLAVKKNQETIKLIESFNSKIEVKNVSVEEEVFSKTFMIDKNKIRFVIGYKGSVINSISNKYQVRIDIKDDGSVVIQSKKLQNIKEAFQHIESIIQ